MKSKIFGRYIYGEHVDDTMFIPVSRWIAVRQNYRPSPRNALWYYVNDGNGYSPSSERFDREKGLFLDFFRHNGKSYAVNQFIRLGSAFEPSTYISKDGETVLSGYDGDGSYWYPLFAEFDEYGEHVRLWIEKDTSTAGEHLDGVLPF